MAWLKSVLLPDRDGAWHEAPAALDKVPGASLVMKRWTGERWEYRAATKDEESDYTSGVAW